MLGVSLPPCEGMVLHVNFNNQNLVGLCQVRLGFEISLHVAYPIIELVIVDIPVKFRHRKFVVQLEGWLNNGNHLVKSGLRMMLWLGLLLMGEELLEHNHISCIVLTWNSCLLLSLLLLLRISTYTEIEQREHHTHEKGTI